MVRGKVRELKTEEECRIYYYEIVNGYSYVHSLGVYVKHYTELDNCQTDIAREIALQDAKKQNILNKQEKLELLIQTECWTKEEETEYQACLEDINGKKYSLGSLIIPAQKEHLSKIIEEEEKAFREKFKRREDLMGACSEDYASQIASDTHIYNSFYRDSALTQPILTAKNVEDLDDKESSAYIEAYAQVHSVFTEKNIKRIAVCPFFLNTFSFAGDNPFYFYGKAAVHCTIYQLALFSRGKYYKNMLSEPEFTAAPEEYYDDLDKVINHYDRQWSIIVSKRNNNQLPV